MTKAGYKGFALERHISDLIRDSGEFRAYPTQHSCREASHKNLLCRFSVEPYLYPLLCSLDSLHLYCSCSSRMLILSGLNPSGRHGPALDWQIGSEGVTGELELSTHTWLAPTLLNPLLFRLLNWPFVSWLIFCQLI